MLTIAHPKLRRLYEYWLEKRGDRRMPSRADLDPLDMRFVVGNIILVDVIDGTPLQFRIRLHGTNLSQRVGFELSGKMLDELPETEFRELTRESFTRVVNTGEPRSGRRDRLIDGKLANYETVIMPLSSDDSRVDRIIVGLIHDDERH
jgi:hypothetical protein